MQECFGLDSLYRILLYLPTFCKTGEKLLGTIILDADAKIIKNVAKGRNFRKLLEKRGRQRGLELLNKAKTQIGGGQNRTK